MFTQMLRQRLSLTNSIPTLQIRKASSLLKPRHPFFNPSTTRTMNREYDPIARTRLQRVQRFYHSGGYGSRSNGVMSSFYFLFAANAMVFGALNYAKYTKDWKLEKRLLNNTLLSPAGVDSGRWWTIITSAFAHIDPVHFAFNMLSLYNFCSLCAFIPGMNGLHLFAVAGGSAVTGGFGFLYHRKRKVQEASRGDWQTKTKNYNSAALGASGAVMGVGAVTACLVPNAPMQLMLIPITFPLWIFVAGYGVVDSYFLDSPTSGIAHAGHLGGLVFGAAYYLAFLRKSPMGVWRNIQRMVSRK
jgi:membrane associated rhomboid family serine protease